MSRQYGSPPATPPMGTPCTAEARSSGVLGEASADWCNVPGPPIPAGPGRRVVHPAQSVNPGPNPVDLQGVQSFNSAVRKKVKNP